MTRADVEPYEVSRVKEALCEHFELPSAGTHLSVSEKHVQKIYESRYFIFTLTDGRAQHRAFGKVAWNNEREYRALQHLMNAIPESERHFCCPIAMLQHGGHSLLLLEFLDGYSSPFSLANSLRLFPNRARKITRIGKRVLDGIYDIQRHFQPVYRPLSSEDTEATPGQPTPTGVLVQLDSIKALSAETKAAIRSRVEGILEAQTMSRRGVVHGALGIRNVMRDPSGEISFIDWEFMHYEALSIYDPCYIVTMVLMRSVQLGLSRSKLDFICHSLFRRVEELEEGVTEATNRPFIPYVLWFGKCLAMIDTLWAYERSHRRGWKALLWQKRRKIGYLAYRIEESARSGLPQSRSA